MDSPSGMRDNDFSMSLSDLGKRDRQFARCRKLIMSAYGYGGGDPGLAKWIVQEAAGVPRKLHFLVLGRLFYIGFTPTPYELEQYDEPDPYYSYKPQDEDEGDNSDDDEDDYEGGDPVYDKHEHNEAAEVHFTGKMLDGTVFASSRESNTALTFKLIQEDVMPGFTLAIASMQPGEKAIFTIPPEFSLTMSGCSVNIPWNIPTNQTLRFDVELISLITDILDDQGILRKTVKFGRGNDQPYDSDEVFVNYTACLMDGTLVSKSEGVEFILKEGFFCPAFAHAVKTMTEGQEVILIIKPEYGFGESGSPTIGNEDVVVPPDATLHVNLKLISWKTVSHIGENEDILKKTPFKANRPNPTYNFIWNHAVVKARLVGKLEDGTVFEQRGHGGEDPFEFIIDEGHVIDGLEECVMTMDVGEVASCTIPPQHAFGAVGSNQYHLSGIPPNSTVIYEIEILSVVNENHSAMTLDEKIESARKKKKEGDHIFTSGNFLRAYRRYFKASQILRKCSPEPDGEIKQMLISMALSGAECAMQLQRFEQASDCIHEVLKYDPNNVEALKLVAQAAQPFPEYSVPRKARAMHRGAYSWTSPLDEGSDWLKGLFRMELKQGHKPSGRMIFVPPSSGAAAGQSRGTQAASAAGSGNRSPGTVSKRKTGLLGSCFGFSSSSG